MSPLLARVVAVAFFLAGGASLRAAEAGLDGMSPTELKEFLTALQAAVRTGDSTQVAKFMYFPLRVNSEKNVMHSYGGVAFAKNFAQVFTPALRSAVLAQDSTQVVRSARGAVVGDSRIWIASVCLDRKCTKRKICVTAVNLGDPAHAPPAAIPGHPAH
jgi:hypothetical protein